MEWMELEERRREWKISQGEKHVVEDDRVRKKVLERKMK